MGFVRIDDTLDIFADMGVSVPSSVMMKVLNSRYKDLDSEIIVYLCVESQMTHYPKGLLLRWPLPISIARVFEVLLLILLDEPDVQIKNFRATEGDGKFAFMNAMLKMLDGHQLIDLWNRYKIVGTLRNIKRTSKIMTCCYQRKLQKEIEKKLIPPKSICWKEFVFRPAV
jgi:hypothetical protein